MKKKILIVLLIMSVVNLIAQGKKTEIDSSSSKIFSVEVLTRIGLKSLQTNAPIFFGNKIYTTEKSGFVSCFDSVGQIVWKYPVTSEIITRAVIVDSQFAAGTSNGEIISIMSSTGVQIQSIGIDDSITTNLVAFEYKGDKELFLPKQSNSKTAIFFGAKSGTIYCLDLETLQEYWKNNDSHNSVISQPVVVENKILFSGSDGYLYSIDSRNGLLNWRWKETAETDFSNTQIACDGKKIFLVSKDSQLYCIDLLLGKLFWKIEDVKILPAIGLSKNKKDLYAKTSDKRFLIISANKGTVQKQTKRNDEFDSTPIPAIESDGKIYFTNKNSIFALDKNFKEELIIAFGDGMIGSFQLIGDNKFLIATTTGTILIIKPRK